MGEGAPNRGDTGPERASRAALIGLGMVARTHMRALRDGRGVTLAAIHARDPDRASAFARACEDEGAGTPRIHRTLDDLAASDDLDFAILATPPDARAPIIDALVDARIPVLMEKPVERTLRAARAIVERCETAGVPLGIVLQHRARNAARRLATMLGNEALGTVGMVDVRVPWWRGQAYYDEPGRGTFARDGGGVLISQAIHTLDLMLALLGPVESVQASVATTRLHAMEAEDHVTAGLGFASGAVGSLVASTAAYPGGAESIVVHGTRGSATLLADRLVIRWRDGREEVHGENGDDGEAAGTGGGADPMAFTHAWHQGVIEDFADAIREGRAPLVTGREALRVHALIDALLESSAEGRRVIVPREGEGTRMGEGER